MFSVALSVPYGPSHYEAHRPAEFGLSSVNRSRRRSPVCLPILRFYAVQQFLQFTWKYRVELHGHSSGRMGKAQFRRVKKISIHRPEFLCELFIGALPVHIIANHWMPDRTQM